MAKTVTQINDNIIDVEVGKKTRYYKDKLLRSIKQNEETIKILLAENEVKAKRLLDFN